jgi:hypothetical protein
MDKATVFTGLKSGITHASSRLFTVETLRYPPQLFATATFQRSLVNKACPLSIPLPR